MMASLFFTLVCCLVVVVVEASGRGFQPPLQPPVKRSIRSNGNSTQEKRWISEATGGATQPKLWPNGVVTYALDFDNTAAGKKAAEELDGMIFDAFMLWTGSGLSMEDFEWKRISRANCFTKRSECLLVVPNVYNTHATTVGVPAANPQNAFAGPFMKLGYPFPPQDDESLTPTQIIAHEMGHAWGLWHEQQNPAYWPDKYSPGTKYDGQVFGDANFDCQALNDFSTAYAAAEADMRNHGSPSDAMVICYDFLWAAHYQFSATNWLPKYQNIVGDKLQENSIPTDEVDWDSIMLYSSRPTGKRVYWKPDGTDIKRLPRLAGPSPRDIQALNTIYLTWANPKKWDLLNQPSNTANDKFKKLTC